jgi:soluble lytic murein transglycosylase
MSNHMTTQFISKIFTITVLACLFLQVDGTIAETVTALSSCVNIDTNRIISIESSGNPRAVSFRGAKYGRGLMQISEVCLQEYNERAGHIFTFYPEDLFDPKINVMIGEWYINKMVPKYLRHYGIEDTIDNRLICYNFGIGNLLKYRRGEVALPRETINYVRKYKEKT